LFLLTRVEWERELIRLARAMNEHDDPNSPEPHLFLDLFLDLDHLHLDHDHALTCHLYLSHASSCHLLVWYHHLVPPLVCVHLFHDLCPFLCLCFLFRTCVFHTISVSCNMRRFDHNLEL
jgi:hypothetical protein